MKKQLLLSAIFILLMAGCETNGNTKTTASKANPVVLTEAEIKEIGTDSNAAAQLLVKKAILKEMSESNYTEQEKKELDEIKENIEMEYFLNKKASESAAVDDMEVLQVYQDNLDKLKDSDIVQVLPQLKNQMLLQRREEAKVNYMNSLVEKYDLNSEIKKHFPELNTPVQEASVEEENQQAAEQEQQPAEKTEQPAEK